jgi:hypothetical protein
MPFWSGAEGTRTPDLRRAKALRAFLMRPGMYAYVAYIRGFRPIQGIRVPAVLGSARENKANQCQGNRQQRIPSMSLLDSSHPTPTSFVEVTQNNRRYRKDRVYMVGAARHSYLRVVQQKEGSCRWKYQLL